MSKKKKEERSKSKKKKTKDQVGKLRSGIQSLLEEQAGRGLSLNQIIRKLGVKKKDDLKKVGQFIDALEEDGVIKQLSNGSFVTSRKAEEYTGVVDHVNSRFAYVNIGEGKDDVYVKTQDLGSAVDGDTV